MARLPNFEKMSHAELIELRDEVDSAIAGRKSEAKEALRQELSDLAKASGFNLKDLILGRGGRALWQSDIKIRRTLRTLGRDVDALLVGWLLLQKFVASAKRTS